MVILLIRSGQLCNRLFSIAAFVANSIENQYPVVSASFDDYYHKFSSINKTSHRYKIRFLRSNDHLQKLFIKFLSKFISKFPQSGRQLGLVKYAENGDINTPSFIEKAVQKKLFVQGWPYWDVENFIKHSAELRKIFTPNQEHIDSAAKFIDQLDHAYNVLVGVHVRRGDYKYFADGIYYFSSEIYLARMEELYMQLIALKKNPVFIICSNEKFDEGHKVNFPYVVSALNDVADLMLLSKCDYIFGPPSTYSMWASFYGEVPYNNFFSEDDVLKIEDFSPIIAPSKFANGRQIIDVYEKYIN